MNVSAWCGRCGESFRLAQVVDEGAVGRCPRCGEPFNSAYTVVVAGAVAQLLRAGEELRESVHRLREVAPLLHVDRARLYADLDVDLDR